MKSDLSAFLDDELESRRQATVLSAVARDEELRRAWDSYQLIGDALRRSPVLDGWLTPRIMERLEREPVVISPPMRRGEHPIRTSLAVVATAAGVALVAWVTLGPVAEPPASSLALAPASVPPGVQSGAPSRVIARVPIAGAVASSRMQEYMVAHQTYSPANRVLGGTAYVRTVSSASGARVGDRAR